jgi:hypothetical protein
MTIFDHQDLSISPSYQEHQHASIPDDEPEMPEFGTKRKIDSISRDNLDPAFKRQRTASNYMVRRIDKPRIMTRDDAFQLGLRHTSTKVHKIISNLSKEEHYELGITKRDFEIIEPTHTEKILTDEECKTIESVGKTYSQALSSQLLEITAICRKSIKKHPEAAEIVLDFAKRAIYSLPKKVSEEVFHETGEIPEEYHTLAKDYFEKISSAMGIIIPEQAVKEYAVKLYEVSQKTDEELNQEKEGPEGTIDRESEVLRTLGNLLFLADNAITLAASCLESPDINVCKEFLIDTSHEQMTNARARIDIHHNLLRDTAVHNIGQALNHYTCIEIAKHLLLSNGSFNAAFIDDVIDALVPEALESTEAIKTSYYLLGTIAATSLGALKIYQAKVPRNKNLPSNDLIKATIGSEQESEITVHDVQVTILSGLIENVRQAKVGSCFSTAWLITLLHKHIDMIIEDYTDCIQEGKLTRRIDSETKSIPFQLRTSREGLDMTLTIDKQGYLIKKLRYDRSPDEMKKDHQPTGQAYIWQVPGIAAACKALGYSDTKAVVSRALHKLGTLSFTPKQLLECIAQYSFEEDKRISHYTRTMKRLSHEDLTDLAQYAFGIQTRHALHSAWEQMAAASVSYLSSQFAMSLWVYDSLKESISPRPPAKTDSRMFHRYKNKLMEQILLPIISRMRYRYNHYIEEDKRFFEGNKGVYDIGFYGYELCDTGLPTDFEYSVGIARALKTQSTHFFHKPFQGYPPEHEWKKVSKDEFQSFLQDVIHQTVKNLQSEEKGPGRKEAIEMWNQVGEQFCRQVGTGTFLTKITENLFGKPYRNEQRREFKVNEFTCQSTPWLLRWGGSPDEVIKSLYGYKEHLVGMHKYSGSAESVLAWRINYVKRQPDFIKEQFQDYFYGTVVVNPPHAYVFRPGIKRFQEATNSNLPAPVWIKNNIIDPGLRIANNRLSIRNRNTLIAFIADNEWIRPCSQKQDLQRQELTELSKKKFDELLKEIPNLHDCSIQTFRDHLFTAVTHARKLDPSIGKRYHYWESHYSLALKNFINTQLPDTSWDEPITKKAADTIINFARNRSDVMGLSAESKEKLVQLMSDEPYGQSIQAFRKSLIDHSTTVRKEEMGLSKPDKEWIEKITEQLDNKIFELLPVEERQELIASGLVTDDPNWCDGVHSLFFMWVVNPGTGKLELCRYNKDLQNIEFMHQKCWFPKKKGYYWSLPKNYVTYPGEPTFNVKKYTGI